MAVKPSLSSPKIFTFALISVCLTLIFVTTIKFLEGTYEKHPKWILPIPVQKPSWYQVLETKIDVTRMKIGLVNVYSVEKEIKGLRGKAEVINVKFGRVNGSVRWTDLFPEWINEERLQKCPEIPMPRFEDYKDVNVVVARVPCRGSTDVFRLQVNLVVANLVVRNGWGNGRSYKEMHVVFIGSCEPMLEIFRCEDMLWHERHDAWVYKPDLRKLRQKVAMPVGTCQLAHPFDEPSQELQGRASNKTLRQPREAYVTIIHSSEAYVCGAIALAQSIKQFTSTKDLILLIDETISQKSLTGLRAAGWKTKKIKRIRSPHAEKNAYNEWNYSKLRIWQLVEYDKLIFIDSDFILLRNLDKFFTYPQLSAVGNSRHVFNSGLMLVEPSECTFKTLMQKTKTTGSYNGGDQGFLNEVFSWWHRWPAALNFLKDYLVVPDDKREVPKNVYTVHFLGMKPWKCYRDYDCNWDSLENQRFASDMAHTMWWKVYEKMPENLQHYCALDPQVETEIRMWRENAKNASFADGHWKIPVKDPRRSFLT
nr:putative UDP-glucuronate:xylan alpha-glucuronosyltransferase 4 [Ipomoea trifida]